MKRGALVLLVLCGASFAEPPEISAPRQVVPSDGLPAGLRLGASNNNVAIAAHEGRWYLAWRTAPTHFASDQTLMHVVSSADQGLTWKLETTVALGTDVREPTLVSFKGKLSLYFVELGKNAFAFKPKGFWRIERDAAGAWGPRQKLGEPGEIPWEIKERGGRLWMSVYKGSHYDFGKYGGLKLALRVSDDEVYWAPAAPGAETVYEGGVSEAAFEFGPDGNLWAVTRNEDGDASGWGSHLVFAPAGAPGSWRFPAQSDPERYDSPRMFRRGSEIYLIARRDVGGPFDKGWRRLPIPVQKALYMASYSLRPKRTSLYRIDTRSRRVVLLADLPSAGDTCFPSILQTGPDSYVVANYSSPLGKSGWSWIRGQLSRLGTQIYLVTLTFKRS